MDAEQLDSKIQKRLAKLAEKTFTAVFVETDQAGEPKRRVKINASNEAEAEKKAKELASKNGWTLHDLL